jgi:hypothetical protein
MTHRSSNRQPGGDRRASTRLPIERDVRYKLLGKGGFVAQTGEGKTLNISSAGALFTTQTELPEKQLIELAVNWPARLNGRLPLNLVIRGRVVRSHETQAAIEIQQYDFKTRRFRSRSGINPLKMEVPTSSGGH